MDDRTKAVRDFWNEASCGERLLLEALDKSGYVAQLYKRYELEPFIEPFAGFDASRDLDVLEIGVGLGADHQRFAQAGARLTGIDLTERAVAHTGRRFELLGLKSDLRVADAESLPFADESFDLVYSWGVLHHAPDTAKAIDEVWRVLRRGGTAKMMIYHTHSLVGYMLWLRYGLLAGKPWRSLRDIYAQHLESPGTKAYTEAEAREMCTRFTRCEMAPVLTHGDLLESEAGQRHRGWLLSLAKQLWPCRLLRWALPKHGLFMLIEAHK
ncbi:MAG: class I SAM-dependent methyltransferase [Nitrospirae bacterium]|nr:class I SAM-dependent methyltransferase [Nitrospirota bacterium]